MAENDEFLTGRRRQHGSRRERRLLRARSGSIPVCEVSELTDLAAVQLLDAVCNEELVAVVLPDGEVRFPLWQFDLDFAAEGERGVSTRQGLTELIAAAREHRLWPLSLHLLMGATVEGRDSCSLADLFHTDPAEACELVRRHPCRTRVS